MTTTSERTTTAAESLAIARPIPEIAGAYLFVPRPSRDPGGFFSHSLDGRWLREVGISPEQFVEECTERTHQGVIRGIHVRRDRREQMLVRCTRGVVFDVIIDLRPESPTFGNVATTELRADPPVTLFIPAGCGHGYQSLTQPADVTYRTDHHHDPADDLPVSWDRSLATIPWPLPPADTSSWSSEWAPERDTHVQSSLW